MGHVFQGLGKYVMAEKYFEIVLSMSENEVRDADLEFHCCCGLTLVTVSQNKFQEAFSYLFRCIEKCENLRGFNANSDPIKISLGDT